MYSVRIRCRKPGAVKGKLLTSPVSLIPTVG